MRVLCVYVLVCISKYCMYWMYWMYWMYTYVLSVYVCTSWNLFTDTCSYRHVHTYNRIQICWEYKYVYVFFGQYIHDTYSMFCIQTNTNMQVPLWSDVRSVRRPYCLYPMGPDQIWSKRQISLIYMYIYIYQNFSKIYIYI